MKRIHLLSILLLLAAACSETPKTAAELPAARPADFQISFTESGGAADPSAEYKVSATEASYTDLDEQERRIWKFTPTAADLDAFYQSIREQQPQNLTALKEADEDMNRFGYAMEVIYAGKRHTVADRGNEYIQLEADYNRFMDILATIREFVGTGIADQRVPCKASVALDPTQPRPTDLAVVLEELPILEMVPADSTHDTLTGEATVLTGKYRITAKALVEEKEYSWEKEIDHTQSGSQVKLRLGPEGFQEQE